MCLQSLTSISTDKLFVRKGIKELSVPVGLEDKVQVDLVVVGSVAVSEKGNSTSYDDLSIVSNPYAMMLSNVNRLQNWKR